MSGEGIVHVRNINRNYGDLIALDDVSVDIPAGKLTALIGPNGAGKSTLLSIISGFERPVSGQVLLFGKDITSVPSHRRVALGITRSFQDVEIFPTLTVLENVLLGFQDQRGEKLSRLLLTPGAVKQQRDQFMAQALGILNTVGIIDQRPDEKAGNLSYGQQKLLALARMLPTNAQLFMLDEPGSGLPRPMVAHMGALLQRLAKEHGKSVLLVDHNMELVLDYAEHVIVMHHGALLAQGSPEYVRHHPEVIRVYLARVDQDPEPAPGSGKTPGGELRYA
jgi:ABC-type branched-subunit amino acid transport system ATPase component